ncbi:putative membrane protein [Acinetobacter sp. 723929]|nr:putative membrane protein [Acinetobacter sp. 1289694]EXB68903.1 putative membrane protein [Acinetobacter sp. 1475718]EXI17548.1 putative membrane protein [Acinetobacter sp. 723929]EXR99018.1 putative membrane protein [Acinetobacter sp. 225588]EYT47202.1 putative membrane protein [Acinetobacter sp. 478810]KCX59977.1 putative membrane protein [Acinetobacter pittii]KCX96633.1 putative membrane protein [Acinetobacter sp. 72431]
MLFTLAKLLKNYVKQERIWIVNFLVCVSTFSTDVLLASGFFTIVL